MPHYLDQRSAELLRRRLSGEDLATIARELDYTDAAEAAAAFARALTAAEPLETAARQTSDRLAFDQLQDAIWDTVTDGNLDAITAALAISDARSRRLGLDAPLRLEAAGQADDLAAVTAAELDELLTLAEEPPD
ncbi:hypothetical protein ABZ605_28065 [Streptomyces sp. NPDC012765]|uniref:hypothetical protein n=1 Tax=Streptomyces sp. NPDC012765 TaxID=3155249 RepID=UPI0033D3595B